MNPTDIPNLCMTLGLRGIYEQRVTEFSVKQTPEACLDILQQIEKRVEYQKTQGLRPDSVVKQFNELTKGYVQQKKVSDIREHERSEREAHKEAHEASKEMGFVPTGEVLKKQLCDLLGKGEITADEFELGMTGLNVVHSMAGIPEPKEA